MKSNLGLRQHNLWKVGQGMIHFPKSSKSRTESLMLAQTLRASRTSFHAVMKQNTAYALIVNWDFFFFNYNLPPHKLMYLALLLGLLAEHANGCSYVRADDHFV